jgi:hypothetical protein
MGRQITAISALTVLLASWPAAAKAQNVQNWLQNEAGQIQQGYGSGMINQGQAGRLQNQEAQIVSQDQRYLQQNGGRLTQQESQQIGSELKHLNRHFNGDVRRNNPSAANYGNAGGWYPRGQNNGSPYSQSNGYYPPMNSNAAAYQNPNFYQNSTYPQVSPQQQSAFARYYRKLMQSGY